MHDHARGKVVGTALTVLAKHGFDATSMKQIAEATGIPSEEIVATIGTKDAVVLNVSRDMLADVVRVLTEVDPQTPVVEALLKAHASVLNDVIDGTGPITLEDIRHMGKAVASSPDLQRKESAQRTDMLSDVLTDHFATSMSDRPVRQGLKLWSAVWRRPTWTCSTNRVDTTPKSTSRRRSNCVTGSIGLIGYSSVGRPTDRA